MTAETLEAYAELREPEPTNVLIADDVDEEDEDRMASDAVRDDVLEAIGAETVVHWHATAPGIDPEDMRDADTVVIELVYPDQVDTLRRHISTLNYPYKTGKNIVAWTNGNMYRLLQSADVRVTVKNGSVDSVERVMIGGYSAPPIYEPLEGGLFDEEQEGDEP